MRSPMVTYRSSSKVLSSPRVDLPTALVTAHRKTNITAARITISMPPPPALGSRSPPQPGVVLDGHLGGSAVDDGQGRRSTLLTRGLDIGVEVDDERVSGGSREGEVQRGPVPGLVGRVGMEPLGLEDVEVGPGDRESQLWTETAGMGD